MQTHHPTDVPHLDGISREIIAAAGIHHVDAAVASQQCGTPEAGLLIPYHDLDGQPVMDEGAPFVRLRLDEPNRETGQKYHQRYGSSVHVYLPPGTRDRILDQNWIVVIEGEKKALALADAGLGIPVGLGGFYSFKAKDGQLAQELVSVLQAAPHAHLVVYGDSDVIFNFQFAQAACAFAKQIHPRPLYVSCVPVDAPGKGVDDCRQILGADFYTWFTEQLAGYLPISPETKPEKLAVALLERKLPTNLPVGDSVKEKTAEGFARLMAALHKHSIQCEIVTEHAVKTTGVGKAVLKKRAKEIRRERASKPISDRTEGESPAIDLGQQAGPWTRQVLKIVGQQTYFFGSNICLFKDGRFDPLDAASLVSFVDSPESCSFYGTNAQEESCKKAFGEKEARLVIGALKKNEDVLRPVSVLSNIPVLARTPSGPQLISGYSSEMRILAPEGEFLDLPDLHTALGFLLGVLKDFAFASNEDMGRALAFLFTPTLTSGGYLRGGRAPLFMVSKDLPAAGAGTLIRLLAAIYRFRPLASAPDDPKGAKEDISRHLLEGAQFMYFDNIRGKILTKLGFFESLLTEPIFSCRAPYVHGEVNVERCIFAATSNGAVLSPDLASRTVEIQIRKRPDNHEFVRWPEGSLIPHVEANSGKYLGAIYAIILEWGRQNYSAGPLLSNFRCKEWERFASWFWNTFMYAPRAILGQDHRDAQARLADPDFDMLRAVFRLAIGRGRDERMTASELLEFAVEKGYYDSTEQSNKLNLGRVLTRQFPFEGSKEFAGEFEVTRKDQKSAASNYESMKFYSIKLFRGRTKP